MSDQDIEKLGSFRSHAEAVQAKQDVLKGNLALRNVSDDLDSTLNFRVNSGLKAEFDKLCRENHSTIARELKRFMTAAIRSGKVL
ncbi:hypothetical protein [Pseudomonas sp.]|uniref:hypothetical protein n=1 Tax=Pseudomonas sp. TaxID=306 RepID=UPI003FD712F2